jgi:hypothetical protein
MTDTINLDRGEARSLLFSITDTNNGLIGKRVTWAVARASDGVRVLRKSSSVGGGTTSEVTVTSQTAGAISGTINLWKEDYQNMPFGSYIASLWIDDGAGTEVCTTEDGYDQVVINPTAPRS